MTSLRQVLNLGARTVASFGLGSRCFSSSPAMLRMQRLKKAADVEKKLKEKKLAKAQAVEQAKAQASRAWKPPKRKAKLAVSKFQVRLTMGKKAKFLADAPVDDVWFTADYPQTLFKFDQIVEMNRQANDPAMLDNPEGDLFLTLKLNMSAVKLTKPIKPFTVLTRVAHISDHTTVEPRLVAVLVKNPDLQLQMQEKGATFVGGEDLIAKLKGGLILRDSDFDYLIAHMDIVKEVTKLAKKYPGQLPSEKDGTLGVNLGEMLDLHQNGYALKVTASRNPYVGSVTFSLGKLSHTYDQMMDNLNTYMRILRWKRPAGITEKRGLFINGASLRCPPNKEVFRLKYDNLNEFMESKNYYVKKWE